MNMVSQKVVEDVDPGVQFIDDLGDGFRVFRLTTNEAVLKEYRVIGIKNWLSRQTADIYSIRKLNDAGEWEHRATLYMELGSVEKCVGTHNEKPDAATMVAVRSFIKKNRFGIEDILGVGLIHNITDGYLDIYNLPEGYVIDRNIDFSRSSLTQLPDWSKVIVKGSFDCSKNLLESLKGAPKEVYGSFSCADNKLHSLRFIPKGMRGAVDCSGNPLKSLKYVPKIICGDFHCGNNHELVSLKSGPVKVKANMYCVAVPNLGSLAYAPKEIGLGFVCSRSGIRDLNGAPSKVGGDFICTDNTELTSLEGAPKKVGGSFICTHTRITSLEHCPDVIGENLDCSYNRIEDNLKGCPQHVGGTINCQHNGLKSLEGLPEDFPEDRLLYVLGNEVASIKAKKLISSLQPTKVLSLVLGQKEK
ncbi:MAG: hypothetical protein MJ156_01115 [Alphaproteobacteria bacterium]|nr:hypothetical protein [Alphaproteobacteria bacterium]